MIQTTSLSSLVSTRPMIFAGVPVILEISQIYSFARAGFFATPELCVTTL
jgi:hypothetical protein